MFHAIIIFIPEKHPTMINLLHSVFFLLAPPKKLEYKIPLYPLALRKISDQLTWDLVLFRGGGGAEEEKTP